MTAYSALANDVTKGNRWNYSYFSAEIVATRLAGFFYRFYRSCSGQNEVVWEWFLLWCGYERPQHSSARITFLLAPRISMKMVSKRSLVPLWSWYGMLLSSEGGLHWCSECWINEHALCVPRSGTKKEAPCVIVHEKQNSRNATNLSTAPSGWLSSSRRESHWQWLTKGVWFHFGLGMERSLGSLNGL